jgi:cell division protein FtsW
LSQPRTRRSGLPERDADRYRADGAVWPHPARELFPSGPTPAREAPRPARRSARRPAPARPRRSGSLKAQAPVAYHSVWITTLVLLVLGLCMILSVSVATAFARPAADRFLYVKQQGITVAVGVALMLLVSRLDYRRWRSFSFVALGAVTFSLILIRIPGVGHRAGGATSWIPIGPWTYQPSEFAKLALVVAGSYMISLRRVQGGRGASLKALMFPFGLVAAVISALVLIQPDMGTAIIIAGLALGLLWVGGMKWPQWTGLTLGMGGLAALLVLTRQTWANRFLAFLNPFGDPQGKGLQVVQSLLALGRGGWIGVGPGASIQKFAYLPKAHTDMILAILGEEFGLLGVAAVIVLFGLFGLATWRLARRCSDPLGKYLIAGCGMLVLFEAVINIGGVLGAMPLTGVPLPFISFGRNNVLVMLIAVGVLLSVGRFSSASAGAAFQEESENVSDLDRRRGDRGPRYPRPRRR